MEGVVWLQCTDWTVPGKAGVEGHVLPSGGWEHLPAADVMMPVSHSLGPPCLSSAGWVTAVGCVGMAQPGIQEPCLCFREWFELVGIVLEA